MKIFITMEASCAVWIISWFPSLYTTNYFQRGCEIFIAFRFNRARRLSMHPHAQCANIMYLHPRTTSVRCVVATLRESSFLYEHISITWYSKLYIWLLNERTFDRACSHRSEFITAILWVYHGNIRLHLQAHQIRNRKCHNKGKCECECNSNRDTRVKLTVSSYYQIAISTAQLLKRCIVMPPQTRGGNLRTENSM